MAQLDLDGLNERQKEAVTTTEGRVLVLAGAGSGKTRVLIERIAYLLLEKGVEPESILALTFTNKAAKEMRERLLARVKSLALSKQMIDRIKKQLTIATFHSFALKMLRQMGPAFGLERRFTLYSEYDMRRLYQRLIRELLVGEGELPSLQQTLSLIDKARTARLCPKEIEEGTSEHCQAVFTSTESWHRQFCGQLLERMRSALSAYRALDFQGLIEKLLEFVERGLDGQDLSPSQSKALEKLSVLRYLMIDEYQDTDPIQDALAISIASFSAGIRRDGKANLCVVGDDDQSIYAWRGAQIKNILEFAADHVVKLEQNYRSTKTILRAANSVIAENKERYNKQLWSRHRDGDKIDIWHAPSEQHEARSICDRIVALYGKGVAFRDIAVLYRSNKLKGVLEAELMRSGYLVFDGPESGTRKTGIPYQVFGGQSLYESKEVVDLQGYLKLLLNPKDDLAFLASVNHPRRGIGDASLEQLSTQCKQSHNSLFEEASLYEKHSKLGQFAAWCSEAKAKLASDELGSALSWILDSIQYGRCIDQEVKSEKMRLFKRKNLAEYIDQARAFSRESELSPLEKATEFLTATSLDKNQKIGDERREESVSLMTLHSSKGLEFPYVFLMGLEDGLIPHERAIVEGGGKALEEERRLLYVGLTRAQKRLFLSMCQRRGGVSFKQGTEGVAPTGVGLKRAPSRFLSAVPKELLRVVDYRWSHMT